MQIWFTSDTHFGHKKIIEYCNRPFQNIDEMDETLIKNWNNVVASEDEVWHLGDFCFDYKHSFEYYKNLLNGKIHFVPGNHDKSKIKRSPLWTSTQYAAEIILDNTHITLCHYAMRVWNHSHHGSIMLYGHSHSSLKGNSQSTDVGVDEPFTKFSPVSLDQIKAHLLTLPKYEKL